MYLIILSKNKFVQGITLCMSSAVIPVANSMACDAPCFNTCTQHPQIHANKYLHTLTVSHTLPPAIDYSSVSHAACTRTTCDSSCVSLLLYLFSPSPLLPLLAADKPRAEGPAILHARFASTAPIPTPFLCMYVPQLPHPAQASRSSSKLKFALNFEAGPAGVRVFAAKSSARRSRGTVWGDGSLDVRALQ